MANPWFPPHGPSASSPLRFTSGESPPPHPPEPPDPDGPFSLTRFPPLGSSSPKPIRSSLQTAKSFRPAKKLNVTKTAVVTPQGGSAPNSTVVPPSAIVRSGNTVHPNHGNFKVLPPKVSSPIRANKAAGPLHFKPISPPPAIASLPPCPRPKSTPLINPSSSTHSPLLSNTSPLGTATDCPPPKPNHDPSVFNCQSSSAVPNSCPETETPPPSSTPLVEKIRQREDKTLKRLAPLSLSDKGVHRVLIPDSVFQKDAEIHKDFIICYFNGRSPPFNQIQSVLNHMWGKGRRVEIHTNPLSRSMLVRIPSDYLRQKILEKTVWYVGGSMFHAVQWSSSAATQPPSLESIQIWAHLTGVPLDLRHTQGLSLVAGLLGDPKETDEFTINLVSLTLSHVKVAVDLTKPLPSVVEFMRENGEVVEVKVSYPWVPPTCTHCKELGHVSRNCLQLPPPPKSDLPAKKTAKSYLQAKKVEKSATGSAKEKNKQPTNTEVSVDGSSSSSVPAMVASPVPPPSHLGNKIIPSTSPPCPLVPPSVSSSPLPLSIVHPQKAPSLSLALSSPSKDPLSPPDSFYAPSLKRSRPDPSSKSFPSFTAQLSFFSSPSDPSFPAITLPSSNPPPNPFLSNPFSILVSDGSLHHEETMD